MKKGKTTISIVVPTYNNEKEIKLFIKSLFKQDYPKKLVEIIVADGGSTDGTLKILKEFGIRVLFNREKLAEPGIDLGMRYATGELIIILAVDNYYKSKNAISKMVDIFTQNPQIYAAFPMHDSRKSDTIYTKYINQFTDPFNHFIYGSASNGRTFRSLYKVIEQTKVYDVYDFKSHPYFPLIALAQGFMIRKGYKQIKKDVPDDVAPVLRIIESGKKIAFVHSVVLYHHTVSGTKQFMRKQMWATYSSLLGENRGIFHRSSYLTVSQKTKLHLWPLYSLTFFPALFVGVIKFIMFREPLWLFHPVIAFLSGAASFHAAILLKFGIKRNITRK